MAQRIDGVTDRLLELWWQRLPRLAGRVSRAWSMALTDGLYLTAWPAVGAFAPLLALAFGVAARAFQFGGAALFTQSVVVLYAIVILGFLSSHLGTLFTVGYVVVDFVLRDNPARGWQNISWWLALLVTYATMAVAAVLIPLMVRGVRLVTPLPSPASPDLRVLAEMALAGAAAGGSLFLYLHAVPVLVRPLYSWRGYSPPVDAIATVQGRIGTLAIVALVVAALRVLLEYVSAAIAPEVALRFAQSWRGEAGPRILDRVPPPARVALGAVLATMALSGLVGTWLQAAILFTGLLAVGLLRTVLGRFGWAQPLHRVPPLVRIGAAFALSYGFSRILLGSVGWGSSFMPLVWALLVSLALLAIALPQERGRTGP